MKTACFLTDCSIDSALTLRNWLTTHADEALRLTVVHAYGIDADCRLTKDSYGSAKQQAKARLAQWLTWLSAEWLGEIKLEPLFSSPELALKMHLLLRPYNYLLLDDQSTERTIDLDLIIRQTNTTVCQLANYELNELFV